jgi:molybdate transport system regulatory protein
MAKNEKHDIKLRIWFYSGENKVLGKGRIELLERIKQTGSISGAAKGMKMSYRQAWQMVEEMNEFSKLPLVEKQLGGTIVTEAGERAIKAFHTLENKVNAFAVKEAEKLIF